MISVKGLLRLVNRAANHTCIYFTGSCDLLHGAGNLASTYYERGQLDLAIIHYKQAIACDGRFLEAYNNLVGHPGPSSHMCYLLVWNFFRF